MSGLSYAQYAALVVSATISSSISITCSSLIIYIACKRSIDHLYHRTVLVLSVADILFSVSNIIHPYLLPKGTPGLRWARGNTQTCSAAGFFLNFFPLFVAMMNAFLSIYFLLVVRYSWKDARIKRLEIPAYSVGFSIIWPLSVLGFFYQAYNPSQLSHTCYYNDFPQDCTDKPDVDCIRGEGADTIGWASVTALFLLSIIGFFCTFLVYRTVRNAMFQSNQWRPSFEAIEGTTTKKSNQSESVKKGGDVEAGSTPSTLAGIAKSSENDHNANSFRQRSSNRLSQRNSSKLNTVATQAILYSVAYLNSFIWPFLVFGINEALGGTAGREGDPGLYTLQFLAWTLLPLQGFFNALVYIRPRFNAWRMADKELSAWDILCKIVFSSEEDPSAHARTTRLRKQSTLGGSKGHIGGDSPDEERMVGGEVGGKDADVVSSLRTAETASKSSELFLAEGSGEASA